MYVSGKLALHVSLQVQFTVASLGDLGESLKAKKVKGRVAAPDSTCFRRRPQNSLVALQFADIYGRGRSSEEPMT